MQPPRPSRPSPPPAVAAELDRGVPPAHAGDRVRLDLAPDADALAQARRFLHVYAQQSGFDEDGADDLVQAAAELLAAGGTTHQPVAVAVQESRDALTVLVDLAGPATVDVADDAVLLLSGLSREWGWRRSSEAVQVWCEVPVRAPR
ncbi:hypothetical protein CLV92_11240 [Kineococcus xinjiangensis]|uniref:Histidine kinase-like protein n=1 Tax=Kineococcus xinjiangensis TaxID=512762 RepID=A0A2S6IF94_9ACTN|nr:hypothetical protein [Kineococcus xinjiangensis]PPK92867.1 hypothetical protein CLV92_11240 [Kineococcus xinjiangensis]